MSHPDEKHRLELNVKLIPEGLGSSYLHSLIPADRISLSGPYGDFFLRTDSSGFVSPAEFLKITIRFEIDSAQFYHDLQNKTNREESIELLKLLERQEIEHQERLKNLKLFY